RFLRTSEDQVKGLPVERIEAGHETALVERTVCGIQLVQQTATILESVELHAQVQVVPRLPADIERGEGGAEPGRAVGVQAGKANVGRNARVGVVGAPDA